MEPDGDDVDVVVVGLGSGGELAAREAGRGRAAGRRRRTRARGRRVPVLRVHPLEADDPRGPRPGGGPAGRHARRAPEPVPATGPWRRSRPGSARSTTTGTTTRRSATSATAGVGIVRGHGRLGRAGGRACRDAGRCPGPSGAARGVVLDTGTEPRGAADRRAGGHAVLDQPRGRARHRGAGAARRARRRSDRVPSWRRRSPASACRVTLLEVADRHPRRRGARGGAVRARRAGRGGARRAHRRHHRAGRATTGCFHVGWTAAACRRRAAAASRPGAARTSPTSGWRPSGSTRARSTLDVDERLRAGERLWAVGDITGKGAYTHVSHYQAVGAVRDLLGEDGPPPTTGPSPG